MSRADRHAAKAVLALERLERARRSGDWDALPLIAAKLAKYQPERAASWLAVLEGEVLLEKQLAASHAVTATVDLAHADAATAARRLPRPAWAPVAADLLQPARALLTASEHPDAALLLARAQVAAGELAPALAALSSVTATVAAGAKCPSKLHVQALIARAYALEQTSDRAGAVATAAVILAWDTPGTDTYICRLLEEVAYRTAALQLEDEDEVGARKTLARLLQLPGAADVAKRLLGLGAYAHLLRPVVGLSAVLHVDHVLATARNTNGVPAYQTEATLLAQQVEWLLTIRSRVPVDAVNAVAIATADILEVIANTPTLVQAYETVLQVVTPLRTGKDDSMMTGLVARYARVLLVLHRAKAALAAILAVMEDSALLHWMATWIYLIVLNQPEAANRTAGAGLALQNPLYAGHFEHAMALANDQLASHAADIDAARSLSQAAHAGYLRAQALLPDCWELEYHIALHYFCIRKMSKATRHAKAAVTLNKSVDDAWHLLALLASAHEDTTAAFACCKEALACNPRNLSVMTTEAALRGQLYGPAKEIQALKAVFEHARKAHSASGPPARPDDGSVVPARMNADEAALASPATKLPSLIASASAGAGAAGSSSGPAPVRVDDAQSDAPAASSLSQRGIDLDATMPAQPGRGGGAALAPLWLMAARAYMQLRRWDDALTCIQNATAVAPGLADIYCVHGEWLDLSGPADSEASVAMYNKALLLDPGHVGTLIAYGRKLLALQRPAMASRYLVAAVNRQQHHPSAWLLLGRLHKTLGEPQTASDCFARALEAEFTMPLREVVFERTLFTGSEGWS